MSDLSVSHKPARKDAGTDPNDPTADYRKYPKGPNFLLIVIMACVALLVIIAGAILLLHKDAYQLVPQKQNPHPNSYVQPLLPPANAGQVFLS